MSSFNIFNLIMDDEDYITIDRLMEWVGKKIPQFKFQAVRYENGTYRLKVSGKLSGSLLISERCASFDDLITEFFRAVSVADIASKLAKGVEDE